MSAHASNDVNYGSYLALGELLELQRPRSDNPDELLFIVVHQSSELWFKTILHELDLLIDSLWKREAEFALFRVERINALMQKAMAAEPVKRFVEQNGMEPFTSTPAELASFQAAEYKRWGAVIKTAGIQPE